MVKRTRENVHSKRYNIFSGKCDTNTKFYSLDFTHRRRSENQGNIQEMKEILEYISKTVKNLEKNTIPNENSFCQTHGSTRAVFCRFLGGEQEKL